MDPAIPVKIAGSSVREFVVKMTWLVPDSLKRHVLAKRKIHRLEQQASQITWEAQMLMGIRSIFIMPFFHRAGSRFDTPTFTYLHIRSYLYSPNQATSETILHPQKHLRDRPPAAKEAHFFHPVGSGAGQVERGLPRRLQRRGSEGQVAPITAEKRPATGD